MSLSASQETAKRQMTGRRSTVTPVSRTTQWLDFAGELWQGKGMVCPAGTQSIIVKWVKGWKNLNFKN
jgi:hypothetical protein